MDLTKISNFTIDHILGSEVGSSYPLVSESLQRSGHFSGVFHHEPSYKHNAICSYYITRPLKTTHVLPVPTIQHTSDYTGSYQRYYGSFNCRNADLYFSASKNRVPNDERGSYPLCNNLAQGGNQRNRGRTRTVFTDTQNKALEQLFGDTDYPCVEARAELARKVGLKEEIVRVWFKNRRARRKKKSSTMENSPLMATSDPGWTTVNNNCLVQENKLTGFL